MLWYVPFVWCYRSQLETLGQPVMLSVLAAKTVADALEPSSIYDLVLQ